MDTRAVRRRDEMSDRLILEARLLELGVYEPGMAMAEMREIIDALTMSDAICVEDEFDNSEMEKALRESELEFMNENHFHSSTMISTSEGSDKANYIPPTPINIRRVKYNPPSSDSSPESSPPRIITVKADVHHPMDWEPPPPSPESTPLNVAAEEAERLKRKRLLETTTQLAEMSCGIMEETVQKRLRRSNSDPGFGDSGVQMSDVTDNSYEMYD